MSDTVAIAAITALAGLGSAGIAAVAAQKRANKELAHDREMQDTALARERIDRTLETGERMLNVMIHARAIIGLKPKEIGALLDEAVAISGEMGRDIRQVMLRLHRADSIVNALSDYKERLDQALDQIEVFADQEKVNHEAWKKSLAELMQKHSRVIDLTVERLGTTISDVNESRG